MALVYITEDVMLDMLKKVYPLQEESLKAGCSFHIDATVSNFLDYRLSFTVYVYKRSENCLIGSYEFSQLGTEQELKETYDRLKGLIKIIKEAA